ncbi:osmotically-inducible lipoprotein OsmE [Pseudomonas sp. CR3202]|uniref:osmotically-inducible lipoprotein OsmE n=1 Tax=Pseudomonas sp. CR3202 TaxID=3351532 RepID=UPI003BEFCE56
MKKRHFITIVAIAAVGGCIGNPLTYRDQPLVAKVEKGMSKRQVLEIAGEPAMTMTRKAQPGTCFEYLFTHKGERQPYMVSFDTHDIVDHKDFRTCAFWDEEQEDAKVPFYMDPGYGK